MVSNSHREGSLEQENEDLSELYEKAMSDKVESKKR
jgi:hypothetical protein